MSKINDEYVGVLDVYEKIASQFDNTRQSRWDWIETFLDEEKLKGNEKIYDIGCGSGRNIRKENGMIGIDNCQKFIEICSKKGLDVILGEMTNLPLQSNSGDGIISIASFHHLKTHETRLKTLLEFNRVIKPKSRILLSVWSIKQLEKDDNNNNTKNKKNNTKNKKNKGKELNFHYGDNLVPWKDKEKEMTYYRYYYIFRMEEILELFNLAGLNLISHFWNHGNEIFILEKN